MPQTIPAPPPPRPLPPPRVAWALWLAVAPGVTLDHVQQAVRGAR